MKTTTNPANDTNETLAIDGVEYVITARVPAGSNVVARLGASELLGLRRPLGSKEFCAWSYPDGRVGRVTSA